MKVMEFGDLVKIVAREDAQRRDLECRASDLRVRVSCGGRKLSAFALLCGPLTLLRRIDRRRGSGESLE